MPRIISPRRLIPLLERRGFRLKRTRGSHFVFQHPKTKLRITVPVHSKDLAKGTLHDILDASGISLDEL